MRTIATSLLLITILTTAYASSETDSASPNQTNDWRQLRNDVDQSAQRNRNSGDIESRRQAIRERARAQFLKADSDRNGKLNRNELAKLRPGLEKKFDLIDSNRDGQVTETEITEARNKRAQERRQSGGQSRSNYGVTSDDKNQQ